MPRIRSIHPEACESEKLAGLSDGAERTFWRLVTHADDEGRGVDHPKIIAAKLYPLDDGKNAETVDGHMAEMVREGLLVRYQSAGKAFFEIHDFEDWQNPRHPSKSKFPPPTANGRSSPAPDDTLTADRRKAPALVGVGDGVGDGGGGRAKEGTQARKRATPAPQDFEITEDLRVWVRDNGITVNLKRETERFLDYHRAKGTAFKDWRSAWRNWMRKAQDYADQSAPTSRRAVEV